MNERKKLHKFKSKIISIEDISKDTKHITMSVPSDFDFYPGQFVSIILNIDGEELRRPYSIASKPQPDQLELCIKILPEGKATPTLGKLKPGDKLSVMGPMGTFFIADKSLAKPITFISTGTGVAPFRSIITHLLEHNFDKPITLVTGYRFKGNILYESAFKELEEKYPNFKYHRICSRDGERKGYVMILIDENFNTDADYYICGLKDMVNSVTDHLKEKGIPKENIFFEKYD
jgi:CDP-4-dehydro-6-deoxyglucose reductase